MSALPPPTFMATKLLCLCACLCLAASASAEIIGVETFTYPDGAIASHVGAGTFWDYKDFTPGAGHTGTASNWANFTAAPAVSGGKLVTSNSSAKRTYDGASESDGAVNDPTSSPSSVAHAVYYRVTVTTGSTLPDFFGLSSYDFGTERIFFGKTFGSSTFGLTGGTNVGSNNVPVTANTTYTLVTKIDFVNDVITLYVNPDLNAPEISQSPAVNATYTATNFSTAVRLASGNNANAAVTWDNLVVATTWDDLGTLVTTTADEDNGSLVPTAGGGAGVSLREAMKYSPNGTLITFAPSLSGQTITLTGGTLQPVNGIATVEASSLPFGITIDGNRASRLFTVTASQTLTLHSLTLTGGNGVDPSLDPGFGGAIDNAGILTVADCTLAHNSGGGGAILSYRSATLVRCTLTGNSCGTGGGGALLLSNGNATLFRCTVSGNTNTGANGGGGIYLQSPAHLFLNDNIVAGNVDTTGLAADIDNNGGTVVAVNGTNNLIGQNTTVASTFLAGPLAGTAAAPLDPKLSPLGYFGGPTQTMHPLIGSPAIDAGGTTDPGTTDQRGFPGFMDGDNSGTAQLDIGAVEAGLLFIVGTAGDDAGNTLRFNINNFLFPGARIGFDRAKFPAGNVTLTQGELAIPGIASGLFIDASNLAGPVTISANNASRVFNIASGATVAMHSLKIINGKSADGANPNEPGTNGGGILNGGSLSLFSSSISSNRTGNGALDDHGGSGGSGGSGGGIFSYGALSLTACTLSGNSTGNGGDSGGGLDISEGGFGGDGGGIYSQGPLSLTACTLSGNATGNAGNNTGTDGSAGNGGDGGGIRKGDATPYRLSACTIAGNHTGSGGTGPNGNGNSGSGGGLFSGTVTLQYCLIAQNTSGGSAQDVNVGTVNYLGVNLLGTPAAPGSSSGPSPIIAANPLLAPLGDYGGPTLTMALEPGSPARDVAVGSSAITDQRGFSIVGVPDLGAYEAGTLNLNFNAFIWETLPASANAAQHARTFDFDGDGQSNFNEWIAGTDPTNAASVFRTTSVSLNGDFFFSFTSVAGRNYVVQYSTDLVTWTDVGPTLSGSGNPIPVEIDVQGFPKAFFRARIKP